MLFDWPDGQFDSLSESTNQQEKLQ